VLLKVVHQFLGHGSFVRRIRQRGAVAGVPSHPYFVFHLNHDDRVLLAVHFLDVPHEGRKGTGVGIPVRIAEGAEQFDAHTPTTGVRGTSDMVTPGQVPPTIWARGKRAKSLFTQSGG